MAVPVGGWVSSAKCHNRVSSLIGWQRAGGGFTLIELLITVVVIAVLTTIAYPAYTEYVSKTRRTEATHTLLELRGQMERYYADQDTYAGATVASLMGSDETPRGYYTLSINNLTANTYTLHATPAGIQENDSCGIFTLTTTDVRKTLDGSLDSAKCW